MFRGEKFRPSSGTLYHNVVLLRMGEIFAPKHVELIEITNKIVIVASSWLFILLLHLFELTCQVQNTQELLCLIAALVAARVETEQKEIG